MLGQSANAIQQLKDYRDMLIASLCSQADDVSGVSRITSFTETSTNTTYHTSAPFKVVKVINGNDPDIKKYGDHGAAQYMRAMLLQREGSNEYILAFGTRNEPDADDPLYTNVSSSN